MNEPDILDRQVLRDLLGGGPGAAAKRQMQFKPLAIRMTVGITAGGLIGIALTILGARVWTLAWQAIEQRAFSAAVLWRNSALRLELTPSRRHARELALYAGPLLLSRTMSWTSSQLPRFILERNLTVTELGLYSLAARFSDIFVQMTGVPRYAVARVELTKFLAQPVGLDAALRRLTCRMRALCFPICFGGRHWRRSSCKSGSMRSGLGRSFPHRRCGVFYRLFLEARRSGYALLRGLAQSDSCSATASRASSEALPGS